MYNEDLVWGQKCIGTIEYGFVKLNILHAVKVINIRLLKFHQVTRVALALEIEKVFAYLPPESA